MKLRSAFTLACFLASSAIVGCAAGADDSSNPTGGAAGTGGANNSGGSTAQFMGGNGAGAQSAGDPKTCAQAAQQKTYLGCDFYPTVLANAVWDCLTLRLSSRMARASRQQSP